MGSGSAPAREGGERKFDATRKLRILGSITRNDKQWTTDARFRALASSSFGERDFVGKSSSTKCSKGKSSEEAVAIVWAEKKENERKRERKERLERKETKKKEERQKGKKIKKIKYIQDEKKLKDGRDNKCID